MDDSDSTKPESTKTQGRKELERQGLALCSYCGEIKRRTSEHFSLDKRTRSGFSYRCKTCFKEYREKNRDSILRWRRKYREKNREQIRQRDREYNRKNAKQRNRYNARHRKENPDSYAVYSQRRRALEFGAGGSYTVDEVWQMYEDQQGLCAYCETPLFGTYHVDHMIPLTRGGRNDWTNLAITCPPCNRRKHSRTVEEYWTYITT